MEYESETNANHWWYQQKNPKEPGNSLGNRKSNETVQTTALLESWRTEVICYYSDSSEKQPVYNWCKKLTKTGKNV